MNFYSQSKENNFKLIVRILKEKKIENKKYKIQITKWVPKKNLLENSLEKVAIGFSFVNLKSVFKCSNLLYI